MYLIKGINIDGDKLSNYTISLQDDKLLRDLSKINIFVGSNNSGKSRFLRFLFKEENYFIPADFDINLVNKTINDYKNDIFGIFKRIGIQGYGPLTVQKAQKMEEINFLYSNKDFLHEFNENINYSSNFGGQPTVTYQGSYIPSSINYAKLNEEMKEISLRYRSIMDKIVGEGRNYNFVKVYIPTLRGLRGLNNHNYYLERTKKDYFNGNDTQNIFTGLDMYDEVKKLLLGSLKDRGKIVDFQKFLSKSFFDDQEVTLIPHIESDVLHVKIGDEKEKPIYDLGDGIQSLIILTFPLFKFKGENLLMFLEEPELYLHPGMQRKFLEIISSDDFNDYQYFMTTHSNHFLDITLDMDKISIYTFKKELETSDSNEKEANFVIENVSNEENNVLKILGVKNSAVFLSNCTIWVEGITDRYYIRHFFNLYQDSLKKQIKFKEDIHFSFVEYSGNNITHWSFLDEETSENEIFSSINESRICSTLFLISDKDSKSKEKRQEQLREKLGDQYHCLDCKEIENLLSTHTLKSVISSYEKVDIDELQFTEELTREKYKDISIGYFIDGILVNKKRKGSYASPSGTISDKVGFCKRAISSIKSVSDLSDEAKLLCEKLYNFISSNNVL